MDYIIDFEKKISDFFGSTYAVSTDCCTHALELCLRHLKPNKVFIPERTYISVPFTLEKLNIDWSFKKKIWNNYYYLENTNIIDAAVFWKRNGYISGTLMCISFQFKKHLNLGRGGVILLDDENLYHKFKKMSYDGRDFTKPWMEQNINTIGYHYYMTPETAKLGLEKLPIAISTEPKLWSYQNYPYLPKMSVFE